MPQIRRIEIVNFRCIRKLDWYPKLGINCLIGPGDAGKTSILDAIDICLGARRTLLFTDVDFHGLNVAEPIAIRVTIGDLSDSLKSIETYGAFLRSFDSETNNIEDEPEAGKETVLTVQLTVGSDLDPVWTLISERAQAQALSRNLTWGDRARLSPTRIGVFADQNLNWRRGSVLNRLTDEKPDTAAALAGAARDARKAFGDIADTQLGETLKIVQRTGEELGIPVGHNVRAMLDAHSVSFSGGTIALHADDGVPLRALGVGSSRLLVAGLQRKAASESSVLLIDELEHGLEPHRIIRLLGSIGAKETPPPIQAFLTTHSPVALRELSGDQLWVVRKVACEHKLELVGIEDGVQGAIRTNPEAFLSRAVLICEGASEIGLLRGLDLYRTSQNEISIGALGVGLVDACGVTRIYSRGFAFIRQGYSAAVLRDDDCQPNSSDESNFISSGGSLFKWNAGQALENAIFLGLSAPAINKLLDRAVALHGEELVASHILSASNGAVSLSECRSQINLEVREILAKASLSAKNGWFKTVSWMEEVARDIIGPDLPHASAEFRQVVEALFTWCQRD